MVIGTEPSSEAPLASSDGEVAAPLEVEICGVLVRISGLDAGLRERLAGVLRPFVVSAAGASASVQVRVWREVELVGWRMAPNDYTTQFYDNPDRLVAQLEWQAMVQAHELSSGMALFHGAALTRGEAVVLLTGRSGTGKTTLTLGLMQRGWLPLTDDVVVVDQRTLRIPEFPRCFHLDAASAATLADRSLLQWLGRIAGDEEYARPVRRADESRSPTCIVALERRVGCQSTLLPITYAEIAGMLASSALENLLSKRERVAVAARLAAGANTCIKLENGELDSALDLIETASRL
jgi:hypothetical protein